MYVLKITICSLYIILALIPLTVNAALRFLKFSHPKKRRFHTLIIHEPQTAVRTFPIMPPQPIPFAASLLHRYSPIIPASRLRRRFPSENASIIFTISGIRKGITHQPSTVARLTGPVCRRYTTINHAVPTDR